MHHGESLFENVGLIPDPEFMAEIFGQRVLAAPVERILNQTADTLVAFLNGQD